MPNFEEMYISQPEQHLKHEPREHENNYCSYRRCGIRVGFPDAAFSQY